MPIIIDKVRIYNFRSIKKYEVVLTPITLLIGANNSGKTSFLKALYFALGSGTKRVTKEDFYIGEPDGCSESKEIIIDIRIIPIDEKNNRIESFEDEWRDKQFGEMINFDDQNREYFSFRTKITYDLLNGDYSIKRYKIKSWSDSTEWEKEKHEEELKQYLDGFPLFFIDAQRDIVQELKDRSSYFGRILNNIRIDQKLIKEIEEKIKSINESLVTGSKELEFLKIELEKLKDTISSESEIEITAINKRIRDIGRNFNINLQDTSSESFTLDYYGMGTRSWASLLTYGAFISWQYKNRVAGGKPYHALLALEEPETHLHPHAQRSLYRQLSGMKGQKIISTHSPFIASQCNLEEIRHFKKNGSYTEVRSLILENLNEEDKRKLRREVLNTRGELLFARVVVLFEGETEEQAFPIFAEKYWNKHPYEVGISFIGVGGDGKYTPFLRLLNSLDIPWYIFSDGEPQAVNKVKESLKDAGINSGTLELDNVIIIENNFNYESYLLKEGYQKEIKQAILKFKKMNGEILNENHEEAKIKEINEMSDDKLLEFMKANKTKLSPIVARIITDSSAERPIPKLILQLFEKISKAGSVK